MILLEYGLSGCLDSMGGSINTFLIYTILLETCKPLITTWEVKYNEDFFKLFDAIYRHCDDMIKITYIST